MCVFVAVGAAVRSVFFSACLITDIKNATSSHFGALSEMRQGMKNDQYGCRCFIRHKTLGL